MKLQQNKEEITIPLITPEEMATIDIHYDEMIEQFLKLHLEKKEQIITQELIKKIRDENDFLKADNIHVRKIRDNLLIENQELENEVERLKENIAFCLHSIKQEMKMSTDSRTRKEMETCYKILHQKN